MIQCSYCQQKKTTNLKPLKGQVKRVGGSPDVIEGPGSITIPLKSDCGTADNIPIHNIMYAPILLQNLLPPQLKILDPKKE